jgi:hypothetical protein
MLVTKFQFTDLMFNQVPQFAMQIRMAFIFLLEGGHSRIQIKFLHSFKPMSHNKKKYEEF